VKKETKPEGVRETLWDDWNRARNMMRKEFKGSVRLARELEWGHIFIELEGSEYRVMFYPNTKTFYFVETETGVGTSMTGKLSRARRKQYEGTPVLNDMKELQTLVDQVYVASVMRS
jgi:hypothetical protein